MPANAQYKIEVYTPSGVKIAEITDYQWLSYTRKVNEAGLLQFQLRGSHPVIDDITDDSQVIVYRRNTALGLDWTPDFYGFFRAEQRQRTDREIFIASCPGQMSLLGRRIVAWYAGTSNRSQFTNAKAETIMKTLVTYNATASATTGAGRRRIGVITGVTVAADSTQGNTLSVSCAWANLLKTLQDVAALADGDFDLVRTGAATWQFRYYPGQLGTDRTSTVLFAVERGNVAEVTYDRNAMSEKTVAIVAGPGEESAREIIVRTSSAYSSSNDIEIFVDARNNTSSELNAVGDTALFKEREVQQFDFKILQTPSSAYGIHYFLGDIVSAQYNNVSVAQKIQGVTIRYDESTAQEQIQIEVKTV